MGGNAVDQFLELMGPLFERDRELLFLAVELFADDGGPVPEFGVDIAELFDDRIRDFRGEGVVDAELAPFADRPADRRRSTYGLIDLARRDSVAENESRGAPDGQR